MTDERVAGDRSPDMTPLLRRGHAFSFVLQICIIVSAAVLGWKNGTEKRSVAGDRSRGPSTHLRVAFFLLEDSDVGFQQSFSGNLEALDVARGLAAENASFAVRVVFVGGPHSSMPLDEAAHNQLGSHNLTTLKLPKERLSEDLGRAGISYERLNYPTLPTETTHHIRQSRSVYRYLKEHAKDIDVAHFVDSGLAYLPLSARRAGLPELQRIGFFHGVFAGSEDYRRLRHGVESDEKGEGLGLKSSTRPSPASTREAPVDATDLQSAYMERKSAEWADSVVFISDSLRRWTTENAGWRFEGSIVTLYGDEQLRCGASDAQKAQTKGLILLFPTWRELFKVTASSFFVPFCSVVATATESNSFSILLGAERSNSIFKESSYTEKSALLRHISAACNGIEVQFSDDFSVAKTLTDLGRADALVVMLYDSKAGSSDLTLAALKRHGVRFVVLPVSADGRELADLALETINKKRFETAHIPRTSSEIMTLYGFAQLHRQELDSHSPSSFPSVSVIITVYERFTYLRQALSSLLAQDFAGQMEIIVVDDGSQSDGAAGNLSAIINSLANEATQRPGARSLRLLSLSENVYLGRARNEGRKLAIGDVLMFMDDDNVGG